uniref:YbeY metalloendoribonuclease n=1 Tax=Serinus canaria TaxID=9135 RepID=A0A8C9UDC0_SERCA
MSVALRNAQRAVPLRRAANALMQRLNGVYRHCPVPTDVLSFPFHQVEAGELPRPSCRGDYNLGDIFLGVEYIHQQCHETGEDFDDVLTVTAAHGLCHLLGFRHDTKPEWEQMYQKETQILEELNRLTGSRLRPLTSGLF